MKVAVVSLKFSPGHLAHLRAYRELFGQLGSKAELFLAPEYRPFLGETEGIRYTEEISEIIGTRPDLVLMYNISPKNPALASACRRNGIRSAYVLHEPRGSFRELLNEGRDLPKTVAANAVNSLICQKVDQVLLCSETGRRNYEKYMKGCNRNAVVFPLIFPDDYAPEKEFERAFFSFIGGFTDVHACREFLQFMEYALTEKTGIRFLIATKSDLSDILARDVFQRALSSGALVVRSGRPMTTEEINGFYRQSVCVWNAYNRSTQSGVMVNALMQGTPVVANQNGAAGESIAEGETGCYISWPMKPEEVVEKFRYIRDHLAEMSEKARALFLRKNWYGANLEKAREVFRIQAEEKKTV